MFIVFLMMISHLSAQDTPIRVTPQFTCWFANYTKVSDTQFEKELYLVFGYTSNSVIALDFFLRPNKPTSNHNRLSPATLPQTQVTHIFPGLHLFAFELRVPTNTRVTWFLANNSAEVLPNMLTADRMCRSKYNSQCPGPGTHNDSSLFLGFCETTFTEFCGERFLCSAGRCNTISVPICPSGSKCNEIGLSCQFLPTPAPTTSIPPTPAPTIPPTPPPTINTLPPPTNKPTTLAPPIITPPPPTSAPTTARRTNSPTRAQTTRRPTPVPTPIATSAPIGLSSPSTTSIIASIGALVASALVMAVIVLCAMATQNVRRK